MDESLPIIPTRELECSDLIKGRVQWMKLQMFGDHCMVRLIPLSNKGVAKIVDMQGDGPAEQSQECSVRPLCHKGRSETSESLPSRLGNHMPSYLGIWRLARPTAPRRGSCLVLSTYLHELLIVLRLNR